MDGVMKNLWTNIERRIILCACTVQTSFLLFILLPTFLIPSPAAASTVTSPVFHAKISERGPEELAQRDFMSVCPPFFLKDQDGNVIDPVHGINAGVPYSPKKTCGQCHDYGRITSGYHFQQGADERLSPELAAIYPWMRSPGQYGGRY